jgi:hypothetical protein
MNKGPLHGFTGMSLRLDQLSDQLRRRAHGAAEPAPSPPSLPQQASGTSVVLPMWPATVRGVPNAVLRSALFGAIRRGRRAALYREMVATVDGVEVLFTGFRLDQTDLDVWSHCLHLARAQDLGMKAEFSGREFLKAIGRTGTGPNIKWLADVLVRLKAANVEVRDGGRVYIGSLLHQGGWDDATGRFSVEVNPNVARLYGDDGWSTVEHAQRQALKGQPLAQWLHGFYSTHTHPYAYKVETLLRLCGSQNGKLFDFRRELREACAKVSGATGWTMEVSEGDLLKVKKSGRRKAALQHP